MGSEMCIRDSSRLLQHLRSHNICFKNPRAAWFNLRIACSWKAFVRAWVRVDEVWPDERILGDCLVASFCHSEEQRWTRPALSCDAQPCQSGMHGHHQEAMPASLREVVFWGQVFGCT